MVLEETTTTQTVASQVSSVSTTISTSSSSSTVESSTSSSSSSSTTESSSSSEEFKKFDTEAGKQFAEYLKQQLDANYADVGYTFTVTGDNSTVNVNVLQDFKYEPESEVQRMADDLLSFKNGKFYTWTTENGYNYNDTPYLIMNAEDGTPLASQGISGYMKVK